MAAVIFCVILFKLENDPVGELIFHISVCYANGTNCFFNPLRLPTAATSPEFGGGRVGVVRKITFKDEFANNTQNYVDELREEWNHRS
jgi:hypothetical protein